MTNSTTRPKDRRAGHVAVQLGEGDDRAGEGDGADGQAQGQLDQRVHVDRAHLADAIGGRCVDGGDRHQAGGHADQGVEGGDQLRHRGHGDLAGDHRAHAAADGDAAADQAERQRVKLALAEQGDQGHAHGDGHADHAIAVARLAGDRTGKAPKSQDEEHP